MTDRRADLWRGIERRSSGYRAVVSQGRGRPLLRKAFPLGTDPREMQRWRKDQEASVRVGRKRRATRGTFAGDARAYLATVTAMPTYTDRARQIERWIAVFGTRDRDGITAAEIRRQRDRWLTEPRGHDADGTPLPPLAPHTVNLLLRALSNLYAVLDGRRSENPVRDVEEAPEPESVPRDLDYATIRRILDQMPDHRAGIPKDDVQQPSWTKIRLRVLAYTGLSAATLKRVRPEHVNLAKGVLTVPGRRKGAGTAAALLPLIPPAVDAFRDLIAADGCGAFSNSSMWWSWQRAARRADVRGTSPYSLRHSFATIVYDLTGDDHLVMTLLQHAALATSQKYRQRAMARVLQRKVDALGKHFGITDAGASRNLLRKQAASARQGKRKQAGKIGRKSHK